MNRPQTSQSQVSKFSQFDMGSSHGNLLNQYQLKEYYNPFNPLKSYMQSSDQKQSIEELKSIEQKPLSYFDNYKYQKEDLIYKSMLRNNYTLGLRDDKDFNKFMFNMLHSQDDSEQIVKDMRKNVSEQEKLIVQAKRAQKQQVDQLSVPNRVDYLVLEGVHMQDKQNLQQLITASGINHMAYKIKNKRTKLQLQGAIEDIRQTQDPNSGIIQYMYNPGQNPESVNNVRMHFEPHEYQQEQIKIEKVDYKNFNFTLNLFDSPEKVTDYQDDMRQLENDKNQIHNRLNLMMQKSNVTHDRKQSVLGFNRVQIDLDRLSSPYGSKENSQTNSQLNSQREIVTQMKEQNEMEKTRNMIKNVETLLLRQRKQNTGVLEQQSIEFFLTDDRAFDQHPRNIQKFQEKSLSRHQLKNRDNSISSEENLSLEQHVFRENYASEVPQLNKQNVLGPSLSRYTSFDQMENLLNQIDTNEKRSKGFKVVAQNIDQEITKMEKRITDIEQDHRISKQQYARKNLFKIQK